MYLLEHIEADALDIVKAWLRHSCVTGADKRQAVRVAKDTEHGYIHKPSSSA